MSVVFNAANRGRALEELIVLANDRYRRLGKGVIHKVPSEWLPIRDREGRIVSAKITKKAAVDFLGHINISGRIYPVAFDAKEVAQGNRWPLAKLEPHQYDYLRDCASTGALAFILVAFWTAGKFLIVPFKVLEGCWRAWREGAGRASITINTIGLLETKFPDYLGGKEWLKIVLGQEN